MTNTLQIQNLHARIIEGKEILQGINLTVSKGEIHAVMGPNGGGKSTLAQVLMGHPGYEITEGKIILNGKNITELPANKRARLGLFLGFQYPVEVSGVNYASFLRMAINEKSGKNEHLSPLEFRKTLANEAEKLALKEDMTLRALNEGFSGGEKKKAEILQLAMLKPDYAILDEPDSGLDVDALKYISETITSLDYACGLILITHYQRILHYIKPDFVHVLIDGKIVKSGDSSLAEEIEKKGYGEYLNNGL